MPKKSMALAMIVLIAGILLTIGCPADPPRTYTIAYDLDGGTNHADNPATYQEGGGAITLSDPTRVGHTFGGWFVDNEFTEPALTEIPAGSTGNIVIFAKWTANTYTVSFDTHGGTPDPDDKQMTFATAYGTLEDITFADVGYEFGGWFTEAGGAGNEITAESLVAIAEDHTLHAYKAPILYNITYTLNGGTNHQDNRATYTIESNTITFADPTRTGYTFGGWYGNVGLTGDPVISITEGSTGNRELWAKWSANTYTVTFNANGGTGSMEAQTFTYDTPANLTTNSFTRTGYTFTGWATSAEGSVVYADQASYTTGAANATLYAKWTPNTYTVTFDANGGIGSMDAQTFTYDAAKNLEANSFTKTGYSFAGWATTAGGSVVYADQASYTTGAANATLYAKWTPNTYTVTFNANGGTGSMDAQTFTYDAAKNLTANSFTRTGYTFAGWATTAGGSVVYADQASYSTGATNATLYAKWTPNTYTVTFDANGGTGSMDAQTFTYDTPANLTANSFTKVGYTFAGWATTSDGSVAYADQASYETGASSITLYARWTLTIYSITYHLNGGTNAGGNPATYTFESDTITLSDPSRTGYSFVEWNTNEDFSGPTVTQIVKGSTGNKTGYAKWSANTYTVTFNANGGSGSMNTQSFSYDSAKNLTANAFTKTGYTFAGWATSAEGSKAYDDEASYVTPASDATLYAKWTANTYTVTFNANGGTGSMGTQSFTYDSAKNLTANAFTRTGYTFAGWATTAGGSKEHDDEASYVTPASDATLYAKWTPNTYTVTFNANGGTGSMDTQSFTYDSAKNLTANAFTRTGYTFAGWATTAGGSKAYDDEASYMTPAYDATLYAKWTPNTYTVTFNANGGTGSMDAETFTYDTPANLTANAFTRIGYTFAGWATTAGGDIAYADQGSYQTGTSDTTLYAKWSLINYTITYHLNGGTNAGGNPATYTIVDETVTFADPTRAGYTFQGWYGNEGLTGDPVTSIAAGSNGNREVWAKWQIITYTITYVLNSGTNSGDNPPTYTVEDAVDFADPNRDHYDFQGWNTAADFSGSVVSQLAKGTFGDKTFYAEWTPTVYTITYHLDGGANAGGNPATYTIESAKITFADPTKSGCYFAGWHTADTLLFADMRLTVEAGSHGDIDLYAKWNPLYAIGDVGPKGGWVFFDRNEDRWNFLDHLGDYDYREEGAWRYMEAAKFDLPDAHTWMPADIAPFEDNKYFNTAESDNDKIGYGKSNTDAVRTYYVGKDNHACYAAWNHNHGLDGWFLPSLGELGALLEAFTDNPAERNFTIGRSYWSSTDLSWDQGWSMKFDDSGGSVSVVNDVLTYQNKWLTRYVRPIRAF